MEYAFRMANSGDEAAVIAFIRAHWDAPHPIIELPDFFDYYYRGAGGALNFALCESGGALAALAGLVPASAAARPDLWVSLWVADPAARGAGLELMAAIPGLTGCRTLACNNIRPKTMPFYNFLGYTTGRVGHFYRLADKPVYAVARVAERDIPPVSGSAALTLLPDEDALAACGFTPPANANPYKDLWYIARRFYRYPRQAYRVYAASAPGDAAPRALLATRLVPANGTCVLRVSDYIGPAEFLPELGAAVDRLMAEAGAEYASWYCAGLPAPLLRAAGFAERAEGGPNIIPNYLTPPLYENTEYYYFTSKPEGFTLFKADGDQDRPHTPL